MLAQKCIHIISFDVSSLTHIIEALKIVIFITEHLLSHGFAWFIVYLHRVILVFLFVMLERVILLLILLWLNLGALTAGRLYVHFKDGSEILEFRISYLLILHHQGTNQSLELLSE
jgi:hypothetical protein